MPIPRFRIRTLMIAVALVGLDTAYVVDAVRTADEDYQVPITEAVFIHVVLACVALGFALGRFKESR